MVASFYCSKLIFAMLLVIWQVTKRLTILCEFLWFFQICILRGFWWRTFDGQFYPPHTLWNVIEGPSWLSPTLRLHGISSSVSGSNMEAQSSSATVKSHGGHLSCSNELPRLLSADIRSSPPAFLHHPFFLHFLSASINSCLFMSLLNIHVCCPFLPFNVACLCCLLLQWMNSDGQRTGKIWAERLFPAVLVFDNYLPRFIKGVTWAQQDFMEYNTRGGSKGKSQYVWNNKGIFIYRTN